MTGNHWYTSEWGVILPAPESHHTTCSYTTMVTRMNDTSMLDNRSLTQRHTRNVDALKYRAKVNYGAWNWNRGDHQMGRHDWEFWGPDNFCCIVATFTSESLYNWILYMTCLFQDLIFQLIWTISARMGGRDERASQSKSHIYKWPRRVLPLWKQIMNIKFNLKKNFAKETSAREEYHEYPEGGAFVSFESLQWSMMNETGQCGYPHLCSRKVLHLVRTSRAPLTWAFSLFALISMSW